MLISCFSYERLYFTWCQLLRPGFLSTVAQLSHATQAGAGSFPPRAKAMVVQKRVMGCEAAASHATSLQAKVMSGIAISQCAIGRAGHPSLAKTRCASAPCAPSRSHPQATSQLIQAESECVGDKQSMSVCLPHTLTWRIDGATPSECLCCFS